MNLNFKIYDGLFLDPKEFFYKTKEVLISLNRIMFDNCRCDLVSKLTGEQFRGLLDATKEEVESNNEYILILKTEKGYILRQEIFDEFENQEMVNEWEVVC